MTQSRPNLTYLINAIDYGGAEIGMIRLLSELNGDEFNITVVALKGANPALVDDLPAHVCLVTLNLNSGQGLRKIQTLVSTIRRTDILVGSLFPSIVVGSVVGTLCRVPTIYTWKHNTTKSGFLSAVMNQLSFWLSDTVLVDSDATRELVANWGINENHIEKLPISGINVDEHPDVNHEGTGSDIRIGTVGSLTVQKGYPELLECAKQLSEYEFHIVGDGPLSEELNWDVDNVVLHGEVSQEELKELWASFDVYFQPSRWEGLCITAIEAMASGLPVVASGVDGLNESVIHGQTGYLVEQGNIDGYCSWLQELAHDSELRNRLGAAGQERVQEQYSAEAFADEFRTIVQGQSTSRSLP